MNHARRTFARVVAERRRQLNLDQCELAEQIGISASLMSYIENPGQRTTTARGGLETLLRVTEALRMPSELAYWAAGKLPENWLDRPLTAEQIVAALRVADKHSQPRKK